LELDICVWSYRFEECGRRVHDVMGNWHVWQCLFYRSRIADLSTQNPMAFLAVNNTSVGSKRFFNFSSGHTWGSPVSLTGNRVLDPTGDRAVVRELAPLDATPDPPNPVRVPPRLSGYLCRCSPARLRGSGPLFSARSRWFSFL
jgi:hypothetical protein